MTRPPADQAVRDRVVHGFDTTFLLEAGAGTAIANAIAQTGPRARDVPFTPVALLAGREAAAPS